MGKRSTTLFCCLIGVLCLSGAMGDPLDYSPGYIRFPFARSGSDFTNICKGYGDFNAGLGLILFHSGVDIQAEDTTEYVRTPFNPAYVLRADQGSFPDEWRVILGTSNNATSGWGYHHLYNTAGFSQGDTLFDLIEPVVAHPLGPHVHIDWCIDLASIYNQQLPGGGWVLGVYDSFINPLDCFLNKPQNYDYPELGWVSFSSTGLRFQSYWQPEPFPPIPDTTVYGQVHFIARPVSAPQQQQGLSTDSVGVRYLRHRVLKQDPYTGEYLPLPWYDWRTLFSMNGFIPYLGNAFFDFVYATTSGHYRSEYLLNNCGTTPVGLNADSAFTNVWTAGYNRSQDWADGVFCRGAFDTRLGFDSLHQQSCDNATAMIPDGRYCVEMEVYSHGSSQSQTWKLPVLDVAAENLSPGDSANVKGFIVDNFRPNVASVLVYHQEEPGVPDTVYTAEWELYSESERVLIDNTFGAYLCDSEEEWLGAAIKFSEPMDVLPEIWLSGEWGGETRWSSAELDSSYCLVPCEWDSLNLGSIPADSNSAGFWQCYRTELGIAGFHGTLRLNVEGGCDLAGNALDVSPGSVAMPRDAGGEFGGGYQQGVDSSYVWEINPPVFTRLDDSHVAGSYNIEVSLDQQLWDYWLITTISGVNNGCCPFWDGFWMLKASSSSLQGLYNVRILDFTGTTAHSMNRHTPFPLREIETTRGFGASSLSPFCLSGEDYGDYCWIGVNSLVYAPSQELGTLGSGSLEVHLFTASGSSHTYPVFDGAWHPGDPFQINAPMITGFEHLTGEYFGGIKVFYWVATSGGGHTDSTVLLPPSQLTMESAAYDERTDSAAAVTNLDTPACFGLSVCRNPVSSELMLQISLEAPGLVDLAIYDLAGHVVQNLVDREMPAGIHSYSSQVSLPSGVYFCRLRSGGDLATVKLLIVR